MLIFYQMLFELPRMGIAARPCNPVSSGRAQSGDHVKPMEPVVHPKGRLVPNLDLAVPADFFLEFLDYGFHALSHLAAHRRYRALDPDRGGTWYLSQSGSRAIVYGS